MSKRLSVAMSPVQPSFFSFFESEKTVSFLFQSTYLRSHNNVICGDDKMEKIKIVIFLTAVVALVTVTIGLTFAHNIGGNDFFGGMMGYTTYAEDED